MHPIFRITPPVERSVRAWESVKNLPMTEIPMIVTGDPSVKGREKACTEAHRRAVLAFLSTNRPHGVILEDDAILHGFDWLNFEFDFFVPFRCNRVRFEPIANVIKGEVPRFGNQAYIVSRHFAELFLARMNSSEYPCDVSNRWVARANASYIGRYEGNVVEHDVKCPSFISEERRLRLLHK